MLQSGRRHWLRLGMRAGRLLLSQPQLTADLVQASYDRIATAYDQTWTGHMRCLTEAMLDRLSPPHGAECIDLTCGTGFAAGRLREMTGGRVTGVDASAGMLAVARENYPLVRFIESDAVAYLRQRPAASADVVTCCWGLGYTRPLAVIRHAARVLRTGGQLAIIDNSLFSLAEVFWTSLRTFAETPKLLEHAMRVRFLPNVAAMTALMRFCSLGVTWQDAGSRSYFTPDGRSAVNRLRATGAAAGFEFAAAPVQSEHVFARFGDLLQSRYGDERGVRITHRYIAAIGRKV